jgi:RecA/RadA recombinase
MTSTVGQGLGSKSKDMLATIMKQLAAMDARLQSMEGRLHVVDLIKAKVTALEESTDELGAQQDTLSSAVEHIDLAQTQFAAAADKAVVDSRQPTP